MKKLVCSTPKFAWFGLLAVGAVACGGGSSSGVLANAPSPPPAYAPGDGGSASRGAAGEAAPASAALGSSKKAVADDARESRGLGTSWGETRQSSVHEVAFERASDRPEAIVTLRYDDAAGVRRLMQRTRNDDGYDLRQRSKIAIDEGTASLDIRVENDDGDAFPLYRARGEGAAYVEGREGAHYKIIVANQSGNRHEIVASVDGLDVVDGRDAAFSKRGYLLAPHGRLVIEGFRKSDDAIAAFRFGRTDEAYTAKVTGSVREVGVIGIAVFADADARRGGRDTERRERANPFPGNSDSRYARDPD